MKNEFMIDDCNVVLNTAYKNDNYKIVNGLGTEKTCFIFFTGNGFYWPNEINIFKQEVIYKDRYEWMRVATALLDKAGKIILIRDIRKNFYVTGINDKINNIDELIVFLRRECQGYDVITCGNSAGGYVASIIGIKLHAKAVFNFGGQWNLYEYDSYERSYFMQKYASDKVYNQYYDITELVKESKVPVFYFYAAKCWGDIEQEAYIHDVDNVYCFAFDSDQHGQGLTREGYVNLLTCNIEQMRELCNTCSGELMDAEKLSDSINKMVGEKNRYREADGFLTPMDKLRIYRDVLVQWIRRKTDIRQRLVEADYTGIAVWGKGFMCELLLYELGNTIKVHYILESNPVPGTVFYGIPIISIDEMPENIDVVLVIPFYDIEDIESKIRGKNKKVQILGLNRLIEEEEKQTEKCNNFLDDHVQRKETLWNI